MKKLLALKLFGLVAFLAFALVFIGVDFIEGQVKTSGQGGNPDKPKPPGKGGKPFQDMPVCILFYPGQLQPNVNPLCDSHGGVTAFAGRRWGIGLKINKNISNPYLVLTLGPSLGWIGGDPDPANDGPEEGDSGNYSDFAPPPNLSGGVISAPEFVVGEGLVLVNIKDMPIGAHYNTVANLIFKDNDGDEYYLFWGPDMFPGGRQLTNPSAPHVYVYRNNDDDDGKRNWDVYFKDPDTLRGDSQTAFLWLLSKGWVFDYCGAYDVSFSFLATEE